MADQTHCCPPNSLKGYLNKDYKETGEKRTFAKLSEAEATRLGGVGRYDVEAYCVGKSRDPTEAIVIIPDIWGWHSGLTRAVADDLASCDYKVVVPKLLDPNLEGGIDGDGLPSDFDLGGRSQDFLDWINAFPAEMIVGKIMSVITALKAEGVERFCLVGNCWGAWAAAHTSKVEAAVVGMVWPHPSVGREAAFDADPIALCKAVQCKVLVMPAGNDPADYDAEGAMFKSLPAGSKTLRFADMSHGWVPRGDRSDAKIVRDVEKACSMTTEFINSCFAPKTKLM